jgi:putative ABC transport system permease protein
MTATVHLSLSQIAAALGLVAVALAITVWQRVDLEGEIAVAVARSFVQLTAIGYVIKLLFDRDELALVVALIGAMVLFGAFTAAGRARAVPRAFWPLLVALAVAASATLGLVVALGVFPARPRYLVPVGGMVIGNAMTAAAVALNRLGDDVADNRRQIEGTLALGATGRQAIGPLVRRSLRSGVIPLIDSTKTTGLIFFPGTMVGMLLAGAAPIDAVRLQLVLLYVLLGGVSIAALVAVLLAQRAFFTSAHQLRDPTNVLEQARVGAGRHAPGSLRRPSIRRPARRRGA